MLLCKPVIIKCSRALISGPFENKELRDGLVKMQQSYFFSLESIFFLNGGFFSKKGSIRNMLHHHYKWVILTNVYIPRTDIS